MRRTGHDRERGWGRAARALSIRKAATRATRWPVGASCDNRVCMTDMSDPPSPRGEGAGGGANLDPAQDGATVLSADLGASPRPLPPPLKGRGSLGGLDRAQLAEKLIEI